MIEIALYIALGFLGASFLALMILPAVWRRAVRLTRRRIEMSVPLTRSEILADRDQMAAEYAIRMRKLEMGVGTLRRRLADQMAEVTRRGDAIRGLTSERDRFRRETDDLRTKLAVLDPKAQGEHSVLERIAELESDLERLAAERAAALADVATMERNAGAVMSDRADMTDRLAQRDARIADLFEKLERRAGEAREMTARFEHQLALAQKEAEDARIARNDAMNRLATGATEMAALRAERETLSLKIAALKSSRPLTEDDPAISGDNVARAMDAMEQERADLDRRLDDTRRERDALARELADLRRQAGDADDTGRRAADDLRAALIAFGRQVAEAHEARRGDDGDAARPAVADDPQIEAQANTVARRRRKSSVHADSGGGETHENLGPRPAQTG